VLFPYLHVLYFDQVHPLLLFLIPSPFLKHYNGFHYSIFIPVNEVLWSYSPPLHHLISSFPLMLLSTPKQSPQFIHTSFFSFFWPYNNFKYGKNSPGRYFPEECWPSRDQKTYRAPGRPSLYRRLECKPHPWWAPCCFQRPSQQSVQ
jgi:hypothetical protein